MAKIYVLLWVLLSVTYAYTVCLKKVKNDATSTQHFFSIVAWGQYLFVQLMIYFWYFFRITRTLFVLNDWSCCLQTQPFISFLSVIIFLPLALEIHWLHLCRYYYENLQDIWSNRHSYVLVSIAFLLHHCCDACHPTRFC